MLPPSIGRYVARRFYYKMENNRRVPKSIEIPLKPCVQEERSKIERYWTKHEMPQIKNTTSEQILCLDQSVDSFIEG